MSFHILSHGTCVIQPLLTCFIHGITRITGGRVGTRSGEASSASRPDAGGDGQSTAGAWLTLKWVELGPSPWKWSRKKDV